MDTSVVVAATRSRQGASFAIFEILETESAIKLLLSVPLLLEYEAKLRSAEQRIVTGLSLDDIDAFLNRLIAYCEPVTNHFRWRPQLKDPGDEMVLETAINGQADFLITHNVRDYGEVPARFGVKLVTPGDFLRRLL